MIDHSIIVGAEVAAGISVAALGLREVFSRAVVYKALKRETPYLDRFIEENTYIGPAEETSRAALFVLADVIQDFEELKRRNIEILKDFSIPNPDIPMDMPELGTVMKANNVAFLSIMKNTYSHKIRKLYLEQLKHRFHQAREKTLEVAAEKAKKMAENSAEAVIQKAYSTIGAAAHTVGQAGVVGDSAAHVATAADSADSLAAAADGVYDQVCDAVLPELDRYEKLLVQMMDELGVVDLSIDMAMKLHDLISDHVVSLNGLHFENAAGVGAELHGVPGLFSNGRKMFTEMNLILDDESTPEDALLNTGIPMVMKYIGIQAGIILDGMTVGASMGTFTALGNYLSSIAVDKFIESNNQQLCAEIRTLKWEIEERHAEVLKAINQTIQEEEQKFAGHVRDYPDISDEEPLREFFREVVSKYDKALGDSEKKLSQNLRVALDSIPENAGLEKWLFIDRQRAVEKAYHKAQRSIRLGNTSLMHAFSTANEAGPLEALDFMINKSVFIGEIIESGLQRTEEFTLALSNAYKPRVEAWETRAVEVRIESASTISAVTTQKSAEFNEFASDRRQKIKSINRRIKSNMKRQGRNISPE